MVDTNFTKRDPSVFVFKTKTYDICSEIMLGKNARMQKPHENNMSKMDLAVCCTVGLGGWISGGVEYRGYDGTKEIQIQEKYKYRRHTNTREMKIEEKYRFAHTFVILGKT